MATDPYIGGVWAGTKKKSATMTTSYALLIPENAARVRLMFSNRYDNSGNIFIRFGTDGAEFELAPGGAMSRTRDSGGVYVGEIYAKGSAGSELLDAEEG